MRRDILKEVDIFTQLSGQQGIYFGYQFLMMHMYVRGGKIK